MEQTVCPSSLILHPPPQAILKAGVHNLSVTCDSDQSFLPDSGSLVSGVENEHQISIKGYPSVEYTPNKHIGYTQVPASGHTLANENFRFPLDSLELCMTEPGTWNSEAWATNVQLSSILQTTNHWSPYGK